MIVSQFTCIAILVEVLLSEEQLGASLSSAVKCLLSWRQSVMAIESYSLKTQGLIMQGYWCIFRQQRLKETKLSNGGSLPNTRQSNAPKKFLESRSIDRQQTLSYFRAFFNHRKVLGGIIDTLLKNTTVIFLRLKN